MNRGWLTHFLSPTYDTILSLPLSMIQTSYLYLTQHHVTMQKRGSLHKWNQVNSPANNSHWDPAWTLWAYIVVLMIDLFCYPLSCYNVALPCKVLYNFMYSYASDPSKGSYGIAASNGASEWQTNGWWSVYLAHLVVNWIVIDSKNMSIMPQHKQGSSNVQTSLHICLSNRFL